MNAIERRDLAAERGRRTTSSHPRVEENLNLIKKKKKVAKFWLCICGLRTNGRRKIKNKNKTQPV